MNILIIAYFSLLFEFLFGHVREQRQTMGERCCGEGSAKHGDALTPGALHHMNNKNAANGWHNFTFERPNSIQKETAQRILGISESASICCEHDWDRWYCQLCKSKVWAKPRMFHGENEPEDWWWCNTCKKQKRQEEEQMFFCMWRSAAGTKQTAGTKQRT